MAAFFPPAEIRRLMQGPKSGAAYLDRLVPRLVRILREAPLGAVERAEAGKALAKLGDPRPGVGLREDGLPDIEWCTVPAGPFLMGSTDADEMASDREKPQHTYKIDRAYAISRYPITNAQYAAFTQAGGYTARRYWTAAGWAWRERGGIIGPEDYGAPYTLANHPRVGVTWYEAVAYCRWLTEVLRVHGELTENQEIRLPTEPAWEKAARGTDGRIYPWGEEPDPERANYDETGIGTTSAVGCFPGGAYGVEDLSGNVYEWCGTKWEDDYRDYVNDHVAEGNALRVLRGGAFLDDPGGVRCASRFRLSPYSRGSNLGFRLVVSPYL
jgi:formylglycine-generating enzyme required for sulfatase activity